MEKISLPDIAKSRASKRDSISKPDSYYNRYSEFFDAARDLKLTVFEIGVYEGESTKIFAEYFANSQIVGVDLHLRNIDLEGFENVALFSGSQCDRELLTSLTDRYAPKGIDIVIDDASHEGRLSLETFNILFPLLKSGGMYIVEDWGTGYWPHWPDGQAYPGVSIEGERIISHDFGMVGFVKTLIDRITSGKLSHKPNDVASIHFYPGIVLLKKG